MIAKEIMDANVITCSPFDNVLHICNLIDKNKADTVIVVNDKQQPVGLISYRDITFFKLAMASGLEGLSQTKIKDIMTIKPLCIYEDASIEIVINILANKSINAAPVVDYSVKLNGIILRDHILVCIRRLLGFDLSCFNDLKREHLIKIKAEDIMTKDPIFCKPNDTMIKADKIMAKHHIGHVPIVKDTEQKEVVGVVSLRDLNLMFSNSSKGSSKRSMGNRIEKIMNNKPYIVEAKETLDNMITLMTEKNIGSLPVVENMNNKKLIGIVCKRDICVALNKIKEI